MGSNAVLKHMVQGFVLCVLFGMLFCVPLHGKTRKTPQRQSNGVPSKTTHNKERIFDIILRANAARKLFRFGTAGSHVPEPQELFQGDIVMTSEIRSALAGSGTDEMVIRPHKLRQSGGRHKRAVNSNSIHKWPIVSGSRQIPYVVEATSAADQTLIEDAMTHWTTNVPCISFVSRTTQTDYISFFKGQGCYSWTGRQGGVQRVSIGTGCSVVGVIAHEIGHVIGFWHEQSRPDRDSYVRILWNNVETGKEQEFKKILDGTDDLGVSYDYDSLMHYGPNAFNKANGLNTMEMLNGSIAFGGASTLSTKDIDQARLLYCPGTTACSSLYTDSGSHCQYWLSQGYCDDSTHKAFMKANCKKSCLCRACEDTNANCPAYLAQGLCTNPIYKATMSIRCRKTCGLCS